MLPEYSRRWLLSAVVLVPAAVQAQESGPQAPIAALDEGLLTVMHDGRGTPFAQRAAILAPLIDRTFALKTILQETVGPRFADMPPADQARLLQAFADFTLASYVANFDSYSGERFEISPQTRAVGNEQVVTTHIVPASGTPIRLDYVMRQFPDGWRVVDVLVDGSISRVAVQRSDFRSLLSAGTAGPLINALRDRTAKLAAGNKS
jgi:phospholipid transport system substrate-binding protein